MSAGFVVSVEAYNRRRHHHRPAEHKGLTWYPLGLASKQNPQQGYPHQLEALK
jgi:hypothetical protein